MQVFQIRALFGESPRPPACDEMINIDAGARVVKPGDAPAEDRAINWTLKKKKKKKKRLKCS
jgi:hypothetical protein